MNSAENYTWSNRGRLQNTIQTVRELRKTIISKNQKENIKTLIICTKFFIIK